MSRLFDDTSSEYLYLAAAPVVAYPFAMACRFRSDDLTLNQSLMWVGDKDDSDHHCWLQLAGDVAGDYVQAASHHYGGGTAYWAETSLAYSANTWQHAAGIWLAVDERHVYLNGGNKGSSADAVSAIADHDAVSIGMNRDVSPNKPMSGMIAEAAIWDLTAWGADDAARELAFEKALASMASGYSPGFFPLGLKAYWPLVRGLNDRTGGFNLTASGTAVSSHPRVFYPTRPQIGTSLNRVVNVSSLGLTATLNAPTVTYDFVHSVSALALAATLQVPTVKVETTVTPTALALALSIQSPTPKYDFKHSVSALALALTLQTPTINYDYVHSVSALALALTLQAPTIDPSQKVSPAALALVASLYAPAINYDYTHTVTALALAASIQSPTLNYDFAFSVSALALAATLQTPTPCYDYKHSVSALALALTLQAPDVLMTHSALPPLMQKMLIDPYSGGAWIWLVKIEITGQATQYIARNTEDVVYYSQTYTKGNVDISGQQYTGGCSVPSVNIRIAQDGTGTLEGIINDSNGGEDGTVTLIRTHEDFFTDSIAPLEMSYDIIKAGSDSQWVNLEIGIPNPLTQRLLADMYSSTKCSEAKPSRFKGPKCQYAGANTSCTGKYSDCYTKGNHVHWCGDLGLDGNVVRV